MKMKNLVRTLLAIIMLLYIGNGLEVKAEENVESEADFVQMSISGGPGVVLNNQISNALTDACNMVENRITEYTAVVPVRSYTDEDLYILAHVICGEAQSYSDEEQRYVGSVVLNRVNSDRYPNTIKGVVFQKNQYTCTRDGNYYRTPTESNWANAKYLLENGSVLPGNVVYQSGGRQGKGVYLKTAKHYYCYY